MKTKTNIRLLTILMMGAIVALGSTDANAQRRTRETTTTVNRSDENKNRKEAERSSTDVRRDEPRDHRTYNDTHSRKPEGPVYYGDRKDDHRRDYHPDVPEHRKPDYRHDWDRRDPHFYGESYHHPRYGETYRRFNSTPLSFRYPHGIYYYHHGHFFNYYDGIGYVVVDLPMYTIFPQLPVHCDRFRYHGRVYYRYGDLYFELNPRGYCLVPSPFEIHLSVQF